MAGRSLLVLKFGGTSMGTRDSISRVIEIIRTQARQSGVLTVISAMAGVTNRLLGLGQEALRGKSRSVEAEIQSLRALHEDTFGALTSSPSFQNWMRGFLDQQFQEVREISHGILLLREFSNRIQDKILSYGEILSSTLLARILQTMDDRFCHSDARDWTVAEGTRQGPVVDFPETERRVQRLLLPLLKRRFL